MDARKLSDKLMTKLRDLSEKPDGWGDIRMIEPVDARAILAALPSDAAQAPATPMELSGVKDVIESGDGFWRSCSGCHETNEGAETGHYPYSKVLKCHLGAGCSECGGIGAVWDDADYGAMADAMHAKMIAQESAAPVAPAAAALPDKRAAFEAWAKSRCYDLTRCSSEAYAAYKSDLTEGAWSGWLAAPQLSTETADKPVQRMSDAERDVLAERARQVTVEGWTPNHDDHHDEGQLAAVAGYYALACSFPHSRDLGRGQIPAYWPWDKSWWKPTTARRNLVKAGALIIAEIERIDRADSGAESADAQNGAQ